MGDEKGGRSRIDPEAIARLGVVGRVGNDVFRRKGARSSARRISKGLRRTARRRSLREVADMIVFAAEGMVRARGRLPLNRMQP